MEPIKRIGIHIQVADAIKKYSEENKLRTGDRLPSERDLASMLGISRATVREGLRMLEGMGYVEVITGKGIYIKNIMDSAIVLNISKETESAVELLEIKKIIDRHAVNAAIDKATNEEIELIEKRLLALENKYAQTDTWFEEDWAFHCEIYKCCKNEILYNFITSTINFMTESGWSNLVSNSDITFAASLPLHRKLYEAIKERNKSEGQKVVDKLYDILVDELITLNIK